MKCARNEKSTILYIYTKLRAPSVSEGDGEWDNTKRSVARTFARTSLPKLLDKRQPMSSGARSPASRDLAALRSGLWWQVCSAVRL